MPSVYFNGTKQNDIKWIRYKENSIEEEGNPSTNGPFTKSVISFYKTTITCPDVLAITLTVDSTFSCYANTKTNLSDVPCGYIKIAYQ